ncbi:MAG: hypothetical protein ABSD02_16170 [Steroidobacteraceae bacterium]
MAVNVSGVQFRDGSLVRPVADAISAAGIESRMIELGFSEGALIEHSTAVSYLKDCDATQVQGFLFCRPLPIGDLERWHADRLLSRRQRDAGAA